MSESKGSDSRNLDFKRAYDRMFAQCARQDEALVLAAAQVARLTEELMQDRELLTQGAASMKKARETMRELRSERDALQERLRASEVECKRLERKRWEAVQQARMESRTCEQQRLSMESALANMEEGDYPGAQGVLRHGPPSEARDLIINLRGALRDAGKFRSPHEEDIYDEEVLMLLAATATYLGEPTPPQESDDQT